MSKPSRLTLPSVARAYRLSTARGAFAVHEAGRPVRGTALLVPGYTGSKEDFVGLLEPLAGAGYRVVAVDGRGQYESPGPRDEAAYGLEELARDVLAQAAALGGGPLHLVGHSLGGLIARAAVLRDAVPFASLTLMSSGPGAITEVQQARTKLLVAGLEALRDDMPALWAAMRAQDPQNPEDPDDTVPDGPAMTEFLRERWLATVPEQLIATGRALIGEPDRVAELALVPLPKLVLSGMVDYAWPVPLLDDMAVRLSATRVVVEDAEHSPNAENPQVTAGALASFWETVPLM
ncbi:alpha/beta fold hydrolase [Streptomyces sp. NPDC058623]|uniref:alpha/beta fold hydrolase n=1 Tax=Streptomyces sp. NPDC058623 TaxID=3346563 RepID=UPI00366809B8